MVFSRGSIIVRRMGQNVIPQDTLGELSKPLPDDHKRQELAPEDDAEEEDETAPLKSSTTEAGAVANHLSNSKDLGRRASPSLLPQSQQGPLAKLDVKGAHKKDREDAERCEGRAHPSVSCLVDFWLHMNCFLEY